MKRLLQWTFAIVLLAGALIAQAEKRDIMEKQVKADEYTLAIYYWPNFHLDAFHQSKLGKGWTEWDLVKLGKPKFEGHYQPKRPLEPGRDESNPREMARSIDMMADAGIDVIIFDWYRYDDTINGGRMIEGALQNGFLNAPNRERVKFSLMWANHDYIDCYPFEEGQYWGDPRVDVWRKGAVSRAAFDRHTDDAIKTYFTQPNYWKIDGKPYFSVYELDTLIKGLGGIQATREALDGFRERVKAAGFPGLHFNAISFCAQRAFDLCQGQSFPGDPGRKIESMSDLMAALGVDSVTWYTWIHHIWPFEGPTIDYRPYGEKAFSILDRHATEFGVEFYPHVSMGWDGSPRNYPMGVVVGNTPDQFKAYMRRARQWLDAHPASRGILTINSWNEFVEGSYIEPDEVYGTQYLDAIGEVFGPNAK